MSAGPRAPSTCAPHTCVPVDTAGARTGRGCERSPGRSRLRPLRAPPAWALQAAGRSAHLVAVWSAWPSAPSAPQCWHGPRESEQRPEPQAHEHSGLGEGRCVGTAGAGSAAGRGLCVALCGTADQASRAQRPLGNRGGQAVATRSSCLPEPRLPEVRPEGDQGQRLRGCRSGGSPGATPPSRPRPPAGHLLLLLSCLERQWLPKSKMAPLGVDETIDKLKMMEGRSSSIRKAVRVAFDRAMNHLSRVHGEPASDLSDID